MVQIAPFRALRYARGTDLAKVTSPPHDVLAPGEREELAARDPHNIVRVILGEGGGEDRHAGTAEVLRRWQEEGVMERDEEPALYWYEVRHGPPEARAVMHVLLCRLALDHDHKAVRRHEKTLAKKKSDRLRLRTAAEVDAEPIWLLYRDERGWVDEVMSSNAMDEVAHFTDEEGTVHRLWRIDRPEPLMETVAQFEDRELVIADGHHRYQTALDHHAATGKPEHDSLLVGLVRDTDPGIRILPTHRLVHGTGLDADAALAAAQEHWDVEPLDDAAGPALQAAVGDDARTCALVGPGPDGPRAWLLRLKEGHEVDEGRGTLDALAVTRVHTRLLPAWDVEDPEAHLRFTQRHDDAVAAVRDGEAELAVILPPEPVHAVLDTATEGHLMPQKATFFVPKLRSGLVLGPLDEDPPKPWQEVAGGPGEMDFRMPPVD